MTSNIISAVLDKRKPIWWLPEAVELFWIAIWCALGAGAMVIFDSKGSSTIAFTVILLGLGISFYVLLLFSGWIPVIAPALGILSCYPLHLILKKIKK